MRIERSPSPSQVGFALGRRQFVIGAAAAALLAACGDDDAESGDTAAPSGDTTGATTGATTPAADGTTAPAADVGTVTFGSNQSDEKPKAALAAAIAATGVDVTINTVDHNSFQENFNTYIQQPDDVMTWFAGYRMRAFATKGVVGDISDVWANLPDMSEGFKNASTGLDGKQYFVPFSYYPWAVHYRQSLFDEKGYEVPATWDEFKALCDQMVTDGLIPLAGANDGGWPQMGMFDMLNMRINGYDFHISLMGGKESWTDERVTDIFTHWSEITDYYQPDVNGRTWQEAATALGDKEVGMFLLGTFIAQNFDAATQQDILDDITFFPFPEIVAEHGQLAVEAPIDGFMMAAAPENEEGAKALLTGLGQSAAIDAYLAVDPSVVAANAAADTSSYNALQQKSLEMVGSATYIAQFLDRDTEPDFAAQVVGKAIADFLGGQAVDGILSTVEEQKQTYTFE
jgi:multiple sugar transport system substrate-binding protein